jgi:endoglucanase
VLLGEFSPYSTAELASRVRWTNFVRQAAEQRGFTWAYWEFAAGFGVYDPIKLE